MILILTKREDKHADRVETLLRGRGAEVARFDSADFPTRARVVVEDGDGGTAVRLVSDEQTIDLDRVRVGWHRRPGAPRADESIANATTRHYIGLESELFLDGVWESLDCAWLPALYGAMRAADHKLKQLKLARALGLVVPPTLMTNDADALFRFYEAEDGRLISKLPTPAAFWTEPRLCVRLTQAVTRGDLAHWAMLQRSPMLFQRRVDKALELRVTVVGERVFCAAVDSQRNPRTAVDSRADFARSVWTAHALDPSVARACATMTRRLGLAYSTIDFIVTPSGEHVFLELNPNGQYLWIEDATGLPISGAIADLLVELDRCDVRDERAAG